MTHQHPEHTHPGAEAPAGAWQEEELVAEFVEQTAALAGERRVRWVDRPHLISVVSAREAVPTRTSPILRFYGAAQALTLALPPAVRDRLCLSTEPALTARRANDRRVVEGAARHVLDLLARVLDDVALDGAACRRRGTALGTGAAAGRNRRRSGRLNPLP